MNLLKAAQQDKNGTEKLEQVPAAPQTVLSADMFFLEVFFSFLELLQIGKYGMEIRIRFHAVNQWRYVILRKELPE